MFGNKCIDFGYRFIFGFCSEGEHKVRPTQTVITKIFALTCRLRADIF